MATEAYPWAREKGIESPVAEDHAGADSRLALRGTADAMALRWRRAEESREADWEGASAWLHARLRRRAYLVAKWLPVLPGRTQMRGVLRG